MADEKNQKKNQQIPGSNADQEGNDKAPGEERGKGEQVTQYDLKGKQKVDADPEFEQPIRQLP